MAKQRKRRGITLEPRPDHLAVDQLNLHTEAALTPVTGDMGPSDTNEPDLTDVVPELLGEIRRMNSELGQELEKQWQRQESQLQQLQAQREQIAEQALQLREIQARKQSVARIGVLLSLLALSAIGAAGVTAWPKLQDLSGNLDRAIADMRRMNPELQAAKGKIDQVAQNMGQMDSNMAALRQQVVSVNADIGKLQKTLAALPQPQAAVKVKATSAHYNPQNTRTAPATRAAGNTYWNRLYRRPW